MATTVNTHEAKTHLSKLLARVEQGEEVIIARDGRPVARLVPWDRFVTAKRRPGSARGQVWMAVDFDAPLPDDVVSAFEGRSAT